MAPVTVGSTPPVSGVQADARVMEAARAQRDGPPAMLRFVAEARERLAMDPAVRRPRPTVCFDSTLRASGARYAVVDETGEHWRAPGVCDTGGSVWEPRIGGGFNSGAQLAPQILHLWRARAREALPGLISSV